MSTIHSKPIAEVIDWLFDLALRHGQAFRSPEAWLARERYLSRLPTAIAVLKCMDGRINILVATNTPVGILMPFRNLGGMFDLGWPHLGEVLSHHVLRMTRAGRRVLVLITYHRARAELKSHFLSRFAAGVRREEFGALAKKMTMHSTVLDWRSRSLERIDQQGA